MGAVAGTVAMPLTSAAKFGIDTSRVLGIVAVTTRSIRAFTRPGTTPVTTTITLVSTSLMATMSTTSQATLTSIEQVTGTRITTKQLSTRVDSSELSTICQ